MSVITRDLYTLHPVSFTLKSPQDFESQLVGSDLLHLSA